MLVHFTQMGGHISTLKDFSRLGTMVLSLVLFLHSLATPKTLKELQLLFASTLRFTFYPSPGVSFKDCFYQAMPAAADRSNSGVFERDTWGRMQKASLDINQNPSSQLLSLRPNVRSWVRGVSARDPPGELKARVVLTRKAWEKLLGFCLLG